MPGFLLPAVTEAVLQSGNLWCAKGDGRAGWQVDDKVRECSK